jgi:glycogen debranching enzyme
MGAFVEAWVRVRGNTSTARTQAAQRFLPPLFEHLNGAGLGHVSEIADADAPHTPRGCPFQAWSLGELIRLCVLLSGGDSALLPMPGEATSILQLRTSNEREKVIL